MIRIRVLLILLCLPLFNVLAQTTYFVSANELKKGNGSIERPFGSIAQALEHSKSDKGEITIYLRGGTYRLTETLRITAEHGNDSRHLTIKAYPGEKAVLSSGAKLNLHWKPYRDGIFMSPIPEQHIMDVLVVDGAIRHMARYPNYDEKAVRFNGTSAMATDSTRVKGWKNPEGGYLHAMHKHDWGDFHYRITGKDSHGKLSLEGGWQNNRPMGLHHDNRMVENIFEELDAPGEWYFDKAQKRLYYYPMPGEDIHKATFESPQLKHLIEIAGSKSQPVKNVTIEGIDLTLTVRTFMEHYDQLLRSDWTIYRGACIIFRGTEHCAIKDCNIYNTGGNAVFFDKYNRHSSVSGTHFFAIGASAVCFVGDVEGVKSPSFSYDEFVPLQDMDFSKGPKNQNHPAYCVVDNNLIHHIGLFEKQITGVELSMCRNITVSHNSIYHTPRAGINISEGTWGGHIIEYNDIFNTVKETGDHGSINSWGRDRFWHPDFGTMTKIAAEHKVLILADILEPNIIRHNRLRCDRGWDIDLDDGSSNYHIYNNLCLNGGIKLREGFYRTVENNIIINNTLHPHLWFKDNGDVFTRNIVMSEYKPISLYGWGAMVDYNIFTDSVAYKAAQAWHNDAHSIVTPIKFANPLEGDYSVADDDPAVVIGGFRNFAMDRFGVQTARLKALASTPFMSVPVMYSGEAKSQKVVWRGATLKSLETLGEQSATGMDEIRGVYVVSVDALSSTVRDYIMPNDVILQINGKRIDNLQDMQRTLADTKSGPLNLLIYRAQKPNDVVIP
ncbi:MAG: PDZ domain-containing protein [Muribaculaceae bacterium]